MSCGNHMYHFLTRKEPRILPFCVFVCVLCGSRSEHRLLPPGDGNCLLCGGSWILYGNRKISLPKTSTKTAKIYRCNLRQLFSLKRLQSSGCETRYTSVVEKLPHLHGDAVLGSGGSKLCPHGWSGNEKSYSKIHLKSIL